VELTGPCGSQSFTNSATLDVDNNYPGFNGEGDSSLTITGTLANTGTVQIGNPYLSSATTVTLGGLTNASGASFALNGSASHAATLDINGSATVAGTLTISSDAGVDLTGPGGIFTQTAGKTVVTGTLSAPSVVLTGGGKLEGTGTVTGAVSNTEGLIAGGSVDTSSPGTLTITGSYQSSGTGTLVALLAGTGTS
jgi:hypothetical protein